jgi:HAD superfamily hydrolase (TIGR01509 family)
MAAREQPMKPGQIKAIIYDCDGVLIDSRESNEAYYNHILENFGQPPLTEEHRHMIQFLTAGEVMGLIFADTGLIDDALTFEKTLDNDRFIPLIRVEPNIREVLSHLRQKYRTAIATNRGKSLRPLLAYHGLTSMFDIVVSSYDVSQPKPDPECLNIILKHFRLMPGEAVYIGDNEIDQVLCERAGMPFIGYKNPSLRAAHHIGDHFELLEILAHPLLP